MRNPRDLAFIVRRTVLPLKLGSEVKEVLEGTGLRAPALSPVFLRMPKLRRPYGAVLPPFLQR
jgi:hypothetical protein